MAKKDEKKLNVKKKPAAKKAPAKKKAAAKKKAPAKKPAAKKPAAKVTPIKETASQKTLLNVVGAKLITGENVVGKATPDGGIDEALLVVIHPEQSPDGSQNNLRIMMIPYTTPIFIKRAGTPDVEADNIMKLYDVPANIADHYLEKLSGFMADPEA